MNSRNVRSSASSPPVGSIVLDRFLKGKAMSGIQNVARLNVGKQRKRERCECIVIVADVPLLNPNIDRRAGATKVQLGEYAGGERL